MKRIIWSLVCVGLCVPLAADAGKVDVVSAKWEAISNPENQEEVRLLVQFDLPPDVVGKKIEAAYFDWPMVADAQSADQPWVHVVVQEVSRSWDRATVAWGQPWVTPGGDLREGKKAAALLIPGEAKSARFEITDTVQAWAKGTRDNYGIVVVVSGRMATLATATDRLSAGDSSPRLRIWYE